MSIQSRLRYLIVGSLGCLLLLLVYFGWSFKELHQASEQGELIFEIRNALVERASLRDRYLLHHEYRAQTQWLRKTEEIIERVTQAKERTDQADRQYLDDLLSINMALARISARIVGAANNQELEKKLVSELLLKASQADDVASFAQRL